MNEFGIIPMTNGAFDIFGSPIAGPFSQGAMLPGSQGTEEGFVDLLSMVEDMSIPDSQAGHLDENVDLEVNSQKNAELTKLQQQWGSGVMMDSASMLNRNELTNTAQQNAMPGLLSQKPVEASVLSLSLVSQPKLFKNSESEPLKVEPWTLALQAGDLKKVVIEDAAVSDAQKLLLDQAKSSLSSDEIVAKDMMTSESMLASLDSKKLMNQNKASHTQGEFKAFNFENVDKANSSISELLKDSKKNLSSENEHQGSSAENIISKSKQISKNAVQDGANFLLDHAAASGAVSAAGVSMKAASLLKDKDNLGSPLDKRISSEALNFVSQQVDILKARGGGQMRVDLHPSDLGSIEITVKKDGKSMSVDIKVEKPDTLKLLVEQKDVLSKTLNRQSKTELSLESKTSNHNQGQTFSATNDKLFSKDQMIHHKVESSIDRLDALSSLGADTVDVPMNSNKDFSSNSNGSGQSADKQNSMSFSKNPDRESSRDDAMGKWEKIWKDKMSA